MRLFQLAPAFCLLVACPAQESPAPAPMKKPEPAKAPEAQPKPAADATEQRANPACFAAWNPEGKKMEVKTKGSSFVETGTLMVETTHDDDHKMVFGVVADVKENTPDNMKNLDNILAFFKKNKAEAILAAGDLGESMEQIEDVINKLASTGLPVFALMGNRESVPDFNGALAAAAKNHPVVNMNHVRLVRFDDAAVISVPGHHNTIYVHAKDGCAYGPKDIEDSKPIVAAAEGRPVIVVGHGPPLQTGTEALDRTLEQANVGSPSLATFLKDAGIHFGVFANIHEAGGRATDLTGEKLLDRDKLVDELFLNPGPADSVRWQMNDGTESQGMAALLTIDGKQASFQVHRIKSK